MFGLGVAKGLALTLKHFVDTFIDDLKYFPKSMINEEAFARRQGPEGNRGLFTVEYPEMKLKTPENFRFLPFLVTDYNVTKDSPDFEREKWLEQNRCTSCGICAKVCPPQCIWIVRTNDPETGKPIPQPAQFYIDTDICMNCGYCAEFCPFDAIKMDHDYELADYEREVGHIHDLDRLLQPANYYASIRPTWYNKEEEAKRAAEEEKRRKEEERARKKAEKAEAAKAKKEKEAQAEAGDGDQAKPAGKPKKRSPEEIKAQREAMLAKKQGRAGQEADAPAEETEAKDGDGAKPKKRSPEEIKAQREAMLAKRQARTGQTEAAAAKPESPETETKADAPATPAEPAQPDDLTKIEGIGPKISGLLQEAGIKTFADLGGAEVTKLEQLMVEAGPRYKLADPATWPEQAKLAAEGKWDELEKLQDQLKGGRR